MTKVILSIIVFLVFVAVHVVPLAGNALFRQRWGKSLLAPRWSVWNLIYVGEAILLLLFFLNEFHLAGLMLLAKPLDFSEKALMATITKGNYADPQALVLFFLPATVLQNIAFFIVPAVTIVGVYKTGLRDIGLPFVPPRRTVIAGLILGIIVLLLSSGISFGLEQLAKQFTFLPAVKAMLRYEQDNPVAQMAATIRKAGPTGLFWGFLTVGIAAPIGEEMLFRGFALNTLTRRWGGSWGIVLSALLFAAPHSYSLIGLTVIFLMGLVLGHIYRVSGSLWTVILIHAVNNGSQIVLAYYTG